MLTYLKRTKTFRHHVDGAPLVVPQLISLSVPPWYAADVAEDRGDGPSLLVQADEHVVGGVPPCLYRLNQLVLRQVVVDLLGGEGFAGDHGVLEMPYQAGTCTT